MLLQIIPLTGTANSGLLSDLGMLLTTRDFGHLMQNAATSKYFCKAVGCTAGDLHTYFFFDQPAPNRILYVHIEKSDPQ